MAITKFSYKSNKSMKVYYNKLAFNVGNRYDLDVRWPIDSCFLLNSDFVTLAYFEPCVAYLSFDYLIDACQAQHIHQMF